jgi:class 3 adenylate cyclase
LGLSALARKTCHARAPARAIDRREIDIQKWRKCWAFALLFPVPLYGTKNRSQSRFSRTRTVLTEPDRVLATVMFTDIVDSTKRAATLGDRDWRLLLDRHDEAARQEITRFRGRAIKSLGDGFLARHIAVELLPGSAAAWDRLVIEESIRNNRTASSIEAQWNGASLRRTRSEPDQRRDLAYRMARPPARSRSH